MLALSEALERRFAERLLGTTQEVLWEQVTGATPEGFINCGYTDNYMRARAIHPRDLSNVITQTRLESYNMGGIPWYSGRNTVGCRVLLILGNVRSRDSYKVNRIGKAECLS